MKIKSINLNILLCMFSINIYAHNNYRVDISKLNNQIVIETTKGFDNKNDKNSDESNALVMDSLRIGLGNNETQDQKSLSKETSSEYLHYQKQEKKGFVLYFGSVVGMAIVAGLEVNPIGFVFIIPTVYANILIVKSNKHLHKANTIYKNDSLE